MNLGALEQSRRSPMASDGVTRLGKRPGPFSRDSLETVLRRPLQSSQTPSIAFDTEKSLLGPRYGGSASAMIKIVKKYL